MSTSVSPRKLERAMSRVDQLHEEIGDDDPQLWLDTIEGETQALEITDDLAEEVLADEALVEAMQARLKRLEARAKKRRAILLQIILDKLHLQKLQRPLCTFSITYSSKVLVNDEAALPEAFMRHAPDKVLLKKALGKGEVPGASLSNPEPVLTIYRD